MYFLCLEVTIFLQFHSGYTLTYKAGLEGYNPTMGDIMFGQKKMRSSNGMLFEKNVQVSIITARLIIWP